MSPHNMEATRMHIGCTWMHMYFTAQTRHMDIYILEFSAALRAASIQPETGPKLLGPFWGEFALGKARAWLLGPHMYPY